MIDCNNTTNYLFEKQRMTKQAADGVCKINCANCPFSEKNNGMGISCSSFEICYPKMAVIIVQEWSDSHPQKTFLTEFLKHYPKAPLYEIGTPKGICPYHLGLTDKDDCREDHNCVKCWNQPIISEKNKKD